MQQRINEPPHKQVNQAGETKAVKQARETHVK
jgi:hypothetical protein